MVIGREQYLEIPTENIDYTYPVSDKEVIALLGAIRVNTNFIKVLEGLIFAIRNGYINTPNDEDIVKLEYMLEDTSEQLEANFAHLAIVKRNLDLMGAKKI